MQTKHVGGGDSKHITNFTDDSILAALMDLFPSLQMTISFAEEINLKIVLKKRDPDEKG